MLLDNKNEGAGVEMPLPPGWEKKVSKSKGVRFWAAIMLFSLLPRRQLLSSAEEQPRTGLNMWHAPGQGLLLQHADRGEYVDSSSDACS